MKNILSQKCSRCNLNGLFCETPSGGDFLYKNYCNINYDFLDNDNDMRNEYRYCDNCGIIFELGCTDDIYNSHIISRNATI